MLNAKNTTKVMPQYNLHGISSSLKAANAGRRSTRLSL